eukprot:4516041-Pleurochrysis_carterae.AAC.1
MITYPAHLATKAHMKNFNARPTKSATSLCVDPLTIKAFNKLWRHAFCNNMIRRQDPPQRSCGSHRVGAMHVKAASDIHDNKSAADSNNMTEDDATLFA